MKYNPKRDLNPHKPAVAAMYLWGQRYSQRNLGSMGFWDSLTESEKLVCRDLVQRMADAPNEVRELSRVGG